MVVFYPIMFLSGAGIPIEVMPESVRRISVTWPDLHLETAVLGGTMEVYALHTIRFFRRAHPWSSAPPCFAGASHLVPFKSVLRLSVLRLNKRGMPFSSEGWDSRHKSETCCVATGTPSCCAPKFSVPIN